MSLKQEITNYSDLSGIAQRAFCIIDRRTHSELKEYVYVTKEDLSWELQTSIPNVKLALRELKETGYVVPKNKNSCWLRVGEEYRIERDKN